MARDLRRYARQTNIRLFVGFILLLLTVGEGLIYWIYGGQAAALGLLCLGAGLAPLAVIWVAMLGIDWIVKRSDR